MIRWTPKGVPVFGIAGASGSGKTTLLEALIPRLNERGLRVGVLKHARHGLSFDDSGKDTDRLYLAGAAIVDALDAEQWVSRRRLFDRPGIASVLGCAPQALDILLIEGLKSAPIEKLWVGGEAGVQDVPGIIGRAGSPDGAGQADAIVTGWLERTWVERPWGLVTPEALQGACVTLSLGEKRGRRIALPLAPDLPADVAPVVSAMRWLPDRAWVWLPMGPNGRLSDAVVELMGGRRPGLWRIEKQTPGADQPVVLFEPQTASELELRVREARNAHHQA